MRHEPGHEARAGVDDARHGQGCAARDVGGVQSDRVRHEAQGHTRARRVRPVWMDARPDKSITVAKGREKIIISLNQIISIKKWCTLQLTCHCCLR